MQITRLNWCEMEYIKSNFYEHFFIKFRTTDDGHVQSLFIVNDILINKLCRKCALDSKLN